MRWVADNAAMILGDAGSHLAITVVAMAIGTVLAVPLGWIAHGRQWSRTALVAAGGIIYSIPSLPLFIILPAVLGTRILDPVNVAVAMGGYSFALMARGAVEAFDSVPPNARLAAEAMGYGPVGMAFAVDLPLAGPVLLSHLRVVTVSTVSLVTVGSLIGVRTLGDLFLDGYQRAFPMEIVVGIVATLALAALLDLLVVSAGRLLMPWTRQEHVEPELGTGKAVAA